MPVTVSYPGVYVEEIPSGVRTITGVATSIAAFIGRARSGPTNEPLAINGLGDFERRFGGLHADYPLGYAVRDFFLNGGSQAIVVRLFKPADGKGAAKLKVGALDLVAASPGKWGESLRAEVKLVDDAEARALLGLAAGDQLFNLTVRDVRPGGLTEQHRSLTVRAGARRVDKVLAAESQLVRWDGEWPKDEPAVKAGTDNVSTAEEELKTAKKALQGAKKALQDAKNDLQDAENDLQDARNKAKPDDEVAKAQEAVNEAAKAVQKADDAVQEADDAVQKADEAVQNAIGGLDAGDSATLDEPTLLGEKEKEEEENKKDGLYALEKADLFNLLCIPPDTRGGDTPAAVYQAALEYCVRRRALLLVDPPAAWSAVKEKAVDNATGGLDALGLAGVAARNAALYFPRVVEADPLNEGRPDTFVPCGAVAGVMARTDVQRGVWKAPAGVDAALNGLQALEVNLTDLENGRLNPLGINCLRSFPGGVGRVVWGARTLRGSDQLADEYKYVPIRRLALFLEESLYRGTKWVVFEPNDEPLWAQIRLNVGAFMHNLFRQGAFQGSSPRDAYLVKCDKDTTTQNDVNLGIVNILVGFAPLKPAEFVILKIQQLAGQIET